MSKPMTLSLTAVVTSVAIMTPVKLKKTPFLGGQGHNAFLAFATPLLTATVKVQGAPATATGAAPASGDSAWTDIATLTSASANRQEIELPEWIRLNTTVLDADGPDFTVYLEGVQ